MVLEHAEHDIPEIAKTARNSLSGVSTRVSRVESDAEDDLLDEQAVQFLRWVLVGDFVKM
jgi:hypothetical protein